MPERDERARAGSGPEQPPASLLARNPVQTIGPVHPAGPPVHQLLDLDPVGDGSFLGPPMPLRDRVFGGLVLGQSVAAANATVPDGRLLRSMHAEFIREGNPSEPICYRVSRIRDGRTYSRREVTARQQDELIFLQTSSYGLDQAGPSRQRPASLVPEHPGDLPVMTASPDGKNAGPAWVGGRPEIDMRMTSAHDEQELYGTARLWYRYREPLPDDPMLHAALWAFFSDMTLLSSVRLPSQGRRPGALARWRTSSLDHALWLHGRVRCTDWLRVEQVADRVDSGFGLATAKVFDEHGTHVSTIAQHGLIRDRHSAGPDGLGLSRDANNQ